MHNNNIEIIIGNEPDDITKELFESFLQKHPEGLEKSVKVGEFVFDSIDLLYYKLHKISLNRGGSYMDSPEWHSSSMKKMINAFNML